MIRRTITILLVLLALSLLFVGWTGENLLTFSVSPALQVCGGEWRYRPHDWPLESRPRAWISPTLHSVAGEWVSLGATYPARSNETSLYAWFDRSWTNKQGTALRVQFLWIKAPVVPLVSGLCLIYPAVTFSLGPCRRFNRRRHGQCLKCGYSLIGNTSDHCPECGLDRASQAVMRAKNESWTKRLTTLALVAMFVLACWGTLSQIRHAHALEYYRENPWRLMAVLVFVLAVAVGLCLADRVRTSRHRPEPAPQTIPVKKDVRPGFLIGGMTVIAVGAWLSDLPNWLLAVAAGVAVYSFVPPVLQRRRGLARLRSRPAAVLEDEYQEVMRRSGLERAEIETLWGELTAFYRVPPTLIRASDRINSDLSNIVGHPDYELFFLEPKILADKEARAILSRVTDWADLIIGIHEIRHSRRRQSISSGAEPET